MRLLGGTATSGSEISFYSDHYVSTAKLDVNTKNIDITFKEHGLKNNKFAKIPIIRSLINSFYQRYLSEDEKNQIDIITVLSILFYMMGFEI